MVFVYHDLFFSMHNVESSTVKLFHRVQWTPVSSVIAIHLVCTKPYLRCQRSESVAISLSSQFARTTIVQYFHRYNFTVWIAFPFVVYKNFSELICIMTVMIDFLLSTAANTTPFIHFLHDWVLLYACLKSQINWNLLSNAS